eukprot:CAMPEP_0170540608 /NCGR_PEP_ID=MMETSP0211-20121228/584_1 /TAXON_ID=311385 /ORGANISM="Pseudokeronopsis sp., Strain OXSARD2" /LENGTH=127 /DNA_ID=CAMNT_0010843081 /DNA_START=403 /DNA_END=786 /DNA_ORIENTATION=+
MYCSNFSLKFVNYPFMVLAKSAKIMPVIIVGSLRRVYKTHWTQYVLASFITIGLIIFNSHKINSLESETLIGVLLVLVSLTFDGLTSSQSDKQHKTSGRDYAYAFMFSNALVSFIGNAIIFAFTYFS